MAIVPDLLPHAARLELEQTATAGPLGGPSYRYRGAVIDCQPGGHVCTLNMPEYPFHGWGFGPVGVVTPLIDLWLEEARMPKYMRVIPPAKR